MLCSFQLALISAAATLLTQNTYATGSCKKCGYTGDLSISPSDSLKWRTFTPNDDEAISVSLDHSADEDTCPVSQTKMYTDLNNTYKEKKERSQFEWNEDPDSWQVNLTNWDVCEKTNWSECNPLVVTTHEDSQGKIYASSEVQLYNSPDFNGYSEENLQKELNYRTNNWCKQEVFSSRWNRTGNHLFIFSSNDDRPADKVI